jgi:tetratricopeptide (TPR) repeat protein
VVNELSTLEKALTKADFVAQKEPLSAILKALKPMRLESLEKLDMGTRGKLLTSMLRCARQAKPKVDAVAAEASPAVAEAPADAAPADAGVPVEGAPSEAVAAAPPTPAADSKLSAWSDVMFTLGLIWRSVGETERAAPLFEAADRQPTEAELAVPAAEPRPERTAASARPERAPRREGRPERRERREERPRRQQEAFTRPEPFVSSGDWQKDVEMLEKAGRTRDAGRIHEKNSSFADAARLYEQGGDLRAALRNAVQGKLEEKTQELMGKLKPDEIEQTLEKLAAWELLMAFNVKRQAFDAVARLYERANQFDQAGLAWERANKLTFARKAYERAKDFAAANRVRDLEVKALDAKGDKLGAATLLISVGRRRDIVDLFKPLPGPKAYGFLKKLKMEEEAQALASSAMAEAQAKSDTMGIARWQEALGQLEAAATTYLGAGRNDKASFVFESMGKLPRAAELAEAAGLLDRAQKLFDKAGDKANVERVAAIPRPPKVVSAQAEAATETTPA